MYEDIEDAKGANRPMSKFTLNLLQIILHALIGLILLGVLKSPFERWEFWAIMGLVIVIRMIDDFYSRGQRKGE